MTTVLAHVSDLHLDGGARAAERARRVLGHVAGLRGVDAVLVSGDIADHGLPAEYEEARALLAGLPLLVAPGVVSTLRLPWEGDEPLDLTLPPALAVHVVDDGGRVTTHYRPVP